MELIKAEAKDLPLIVDMKMRMFKEVGSIALLRDNAEEMIEQTYAALYWEGKGCHFIVCDGNGQAVACGGAVVKEDVPFCFFKTPRYGYVMDVYCVPDKRRNGYASRVVEAVLGWLREQDVHHVKLKPSGSGG